MGLRGAVSGPATGGVSRGTAEEPGGAVASSPAASAQLQLGSRLGPPTDTRGERGGEGWGWGSVGGRVAGERVEVGVGETEASRDSITKRSCRSPGLGVGERAEGGPVASGVAACRQEQGTDTGAGLSPLNTGWVVHRGPRLKAGVVLVLTPVPTGRGAPLGPAEASGYEDTGVTIAGTSSGLRVVTCPPSPPGTVTGAAASSTPTGAAVVETSGAVGVGVVKGE